MQEIKPTLPLKADFGDITEKQGCDVYKRLDPSKANEVIDFFGEHLRLDPMSVRKMKMMAASTRKSVQNHTGNIFL